MSLTIRALMFALIATSGFLASSASATTWKLTDLGLISADAINNKGQIVGGFLDSTSSWHAILIDPVSGQRDLGTLGGSYAYASGINDFGQVVGGSRDKDGTPTAFVFDSITGSLRPIPGLAGYQSVAVAINNYGQVAGSVIANDGKWHPFSANVNASVAGNVVELGPSSGSAWAINSHGTVGGSSTAGDGMNYPFISAADGTNFKLVPTFLNAFGSITGINDEGDLIGFANNLQGYGGYFFIGKSGWAERIGTSLGGINDFGQIVGSLTTYGGEAHAFATGPNAENPRDLNFEVSINSGAFLKNALAINDIGQIVAAGSDGHSYLLSPVLEPSIATECLVGVFLIAVTLRKRIPRGGR